MSVFGLGSGKIIFECLENLKKNFEQEVRIRESIHKKLADNMDMRDFYIGRMIGEVMYIMEANDAQEVYMDDICNQREINNGSRGFVYSGKEIEKVYIKRGKYDHTRELWSVDSDGNKRNVAHLPYAAIRMIVCAIAAFFEDVELW